MWRAGVWISQSTAAAARNASRNSSRKSRRMNRLTAITVHQTTTRGSDGEHQARGAVAFFYIYGRRYFDRKR